MGKIISANWKMNMSLKDIEEFFIYFKGKTIKEGREVYIAPPFIYIPIVEELRKKFKLNFKLGAQNCYYEDKGAFTGEISVKMLKDFNVDFVIIGHSERRHIFGEKDELLNKKIYKVLNEGLKCIFCIGEKLEERKNGQTFIVLENQLKNGLKNINNLENLIIAYEPVWAIGTGINAKPEQIEEAHSFIKKFLEKSVEKNIPILYGGSVKPENINEIMNCKNVDGVLVGGASLIAEKFLKIINF